MSRTVESRDRYVAPRLRRVRLSPSRPSRRDGCVVDAGPLVDLIDRFTARWDSERPQERAPSKRGLTASGAPPVSALDWLAGEIAAQTPGAPAVSRDTLSKLTRRDGQGRPIRKQVELRHADAILTVIGCPEALHDGRLTVRPNPRAGLSARGECCRSVGYEDAVQGLPARPPRQLAAFYREGYRAALTGAARA